MVLFGETCGGGTKERYYAIVGAVWGIVISVVLVWWGNWAHGEDMKVSCIRLIFPISSMINLKAIIPNGTPTKREDVPRCRIGVIEKVGQVSVFELNESQVPLGSTPSDGSVLPLEKVPALAGYRRWCFRYGCGWC